MRNQISTVLCRIVRNLVINVLVITGLMTILFICSLLYHGYSVRLNVFDFFYIGLGSGALLIIWVASTIELIRSHFYSGDLHV